MGDVKTGEGTRTALQLTCCMENWGPMICCSSVYLHAEEEVSHTKEKQTDGQLKEPSVCKELHF